MEQLSAKLEGVSSLIRQTTPEDSEIGDGDVEESGSSATAPAITGSVLVDEEVVSLLDAEGEVYIGVAFSGHTGDVHHKEAAGGVAPVQLEGLLGGVGGVVLGKDGFELIGSASQCYELNGTEMDSLYT